MLIRPLTDEERKSWPRTVKVALEPPFADARGDIQPLVDLAMESAVLIRSVKGAVRGNHYHRSDWHFCYVLQGEIEYFYRDHGSVAVPSREIIRTGELFFTGPMVEHAMVFPCDTVFLTLGRNSRRQEVYEADVVRIDPIEPR